MYLYPNQLRALEEVLDLVIVNGGVLDIELKKKIDFHKKWGSKDRKNFYQAAYDIVRNYELLEYIGKQENKGAIGAYISNMELHASDYEKIRQDANIERHIRLAIPAEVLELYESECTHAFENLMAMQQTGSIYLRVNTSLITLDKFSQALQQHDITHQVIREVNIEDRKFSLNAIQLVNRTHTHQAFFKANEKLFEIQDLGSQIISLFIDFSKANTIVEACAGQGGKTTHILDQTRKNNPLHLACDKDRKKLERLLLRVQKWKDHKVVTELAKDKIVDKYLQMADVLCLDVPCTGSGTMKRQPDIKYKIDRAMLDEKIGIQRDIFQLFDPCLKPGGTLLYSTCSLFRAENQAQIDYICTHGYELEDQLLLEPRSYQGDGFFMARLRKHTT